MTKNVINYYLFNSDNGRVFELFKWNEKKYYMQHIRNYQKTTPIKDINEDIKKEEKGTTKKIKLDYCF